jgi:hypothetical protein
MQQNITLKNDTIKNAPVSRGATSYLYQDIHKGNTMLLYTLHHRLMQPMLSISLLLILLQFQSLARADGVNWESLSPQQQETLAPMKDDWRELPPNRQERLRQGAERWNSLPPEQRNRLQDRMHRYDNMSREEKARIKERMREFKQLPPSEREALRDRWKNMPPDQKERMRERLHDVSPEDKDAFKQERRERKSKHQGRDR